LLHKREALLSSSSSALVEWQAVVGDFGNSAVTQHKIRLQCSAQPAATWAATGAPLTRGVCTLYYAAPEMLLRGEEYGYPVDIWSLGFILLEIEAQKPICCTHRGAANWEQLMVFFLLPARGGKFFFGQSSALFVATPRTRENFAGGYREIVAGSGEESRHSRQILRC
jgi:serine/threonine protein kinase